MNLLTIAAGVMLILLGIRHLRKGLDRLFGSRLVEWLQGMTASRWKGFGAGIVAGAVAPSSTSIALLSVQMLSRAALPAGRMLAVVLGANVGITVTVQLISFHLEQSAAALLVVGGISFLYLRRAVFRGGGQILLAFGLIFLAMQLIGGAATALSASGDLEALFKMLEGSPWALLAVIAVLTVGMQSSTASIALGIGLAQGGLLDKPSLIPWVLGTNVGIAITSLLAGWTSVEGRRLGMGSLVVKLAGAAIALALLQSNAIESAVTATFSSARLAADLHTGFNLVVGLAALPLLAPITRVMNFLVESPPEGVSQPESYLDPILLQSPSLALNQAAREEFRMMDELKNMLRSAQSMLEGARPAGRAGIDAYRVRLADVGERLRRYLGQIGDDSLSADDARWKFILLTYIQELTAIGTLIHRDFTDSVLSQTRGEGRLPAEAMQDISALARRTLERMERATAILMSQDKAQAEAFIVEKEQVSHWCRAAQRLQVERAATTAEASAAAATAYLDILDCFRRINSHLTSAAYAIARPDVAALQGASSGTL